MTGGVAILGAGHAGTTVAAMLRQQGYPGPIELFDTEAEQPYQRPPLSKHSADDVAQWLRPAGFFPEQQISLHLGEQVTGLEPEAPTVSTAAATYCVDYAVLATGAEARTLSIPGNDLAGVLPLRTLGDARTLRKEMAQGRRILIIGGGYIGLEVAAVARVRGCHVTVAERERRVLARVASPELSTVIADYHQDRGVQISVGVEVLELIGAGGRVREAVLGDGTRVGCDVVLVGVGAVPREELAVAAGLSCANGVVVDQRTRTSAPRVLAVGDVTRRPSWNGGPSVRLESIPSATEQARQAAALITGSAAPPPEIPWFWSDQFDLKLKMVGALPVSPNTVVRGDPASGRCSIFHLVDDKVAFVETVNSAADFMAGKSFVARGCAVHPDRLRDPTVALRDTVR